MVVASRNDTLHYLIVSVLVWTFSLSLALFSLIVCTDFDNILVSSVKNGLANMNPSRVVVGVKTSSGLRPVRRGYQSPYSIPPSSEEEEEDDEDGRGVPDCMGGACADVANRCDDGMCPAALAAAALEAAANAKAEPPPGLYKAYCR